MSTGKANTNVERVRIGNINVPVLRFGGEGTAVKQLQTRLTRSGFMVPVTGKFLDTTHRSVMSFQKKYNIPSSGIVDKSTYEKLSEILRDKPNYSLLYWENSMTPKESHINNMKEVTYAMEIDNRKKIFIMVAVAVMGVVLLKVRK